LRNKRRERFGEENDEEGEDDGMEMESTAKRREVPHDVKVRVFFFFVVVVHRKNNKNKSVPTHPLCSLPFFLLVLPATTQCHSHLWLRPFEARGFKRLFWWV
jgi:hypothetical protein